MIMGPENKCQICEKKNTETFWAEQQQKFICAECMRLYNPPYMTLLRFEQGSFHRLWNLEVGEYEDFGKIGAITICDWMIRSRQETLYRLVPRTRVTVYHLEYFGEVPCGRCVDYPYFEPGEPCLSQACKTMAKPFKPSKDIQYPQERSKYTKWMKINR